MTSELIEVPSFFSCSKLVILGWPTVCLNNRWPASGVFVAFGHSWCNKRVNADGRIIPKVWARVLPRPWGQALCVAPETERRHSNEEWRRRYQEPGGARLPQTTPKPCQSIHRHSGVTTGRFRSSKP